MRQLNQRHSLVDHRIVPGLGVTSCNPTFGSRAVLAMRVHVIYAHPLAGSFAAALHARIVAALRRSGHQVDDCDL
jgi:prephenate dehydrogenase